MINMPKHEYMSKYSGIELKGIEILARTKKWGKVHYSANQMIVAATVRSIQKQLYDKGTQVSIDVVLNLSGWFWWWDYWVFRKVWA